MESLNHSMYPLYENVCEPADWSAGKSLRLVPCSVNPDFIQLKAARAYTGQEAQLAPFIKPKLVSTEQVGRTVNCGDRTLKPTSILEDECKKTKRGRR